MKPHRFLMTVLALAWLAAGGATLRAAALQPLVDAAAPGATLELPAGRYDGPVVIEKPLTLRGAAGAEIVGNGNGNVVTIRGDHVTLEGFRIAGSGLDLGQDNAGVFVEGHHATIKGNRIEESLHGVYIKKANHCRVEANLIRGKERVGAASATSDLAFGPDGSENCDLTLGQNQRGNGIHIWNAEGAVMIDNEIRNARDGFYFSFANDSKVLRNHAANVRFGLHYMYSDRNVFENNHFEQNTAGAVLMYSKGLLIRRNLFADNVGHRSYGMVMIAVDNSRLEGNRFTGNSIGLFLELSNTNTLVGNSVVRGYIGVRLTGSSDSNRFSNNLFAGNLHPVEVDGSVGKNEWAIGGIGNHWAGGAVDLDGDGVGDLPHRETDLLGPLRRSFPMVALFSGSPALNLVRFAQQSAPMPKVPTIIDPAPLVHPPEGTSFR
ncbi:MAG TPA: NosD domain-containing protein [Chthoniobacteraceae bacterium]|nr:NosD domain-containing protein [Chthoniobacteraceae bacterium]